MLSRRSGQAVLGSSNSAFGLSTRSCSLIVALEGHRCLAVSSFLTRSDVETVVINIELPSKAMTGFMLLVKMVVK